MPFRFRKSVRLFPGVCVNLSKSGMSVSVGGPGATVNFSSRGTAVTVGLPGTGLSFRHQLTSARRASGPAFRSIPLSDPATASTWPLRIPPVLDPVLVGAPLAGEIKSAEVAVLTSPDLQGLKQLLNEAARQRADLKPDLAAAQNSRLKAWRRLRRREQLPLQLLFKSSIPKARAAFEETENEMLKVLEALALSEVGVEFAFDDRARAAQDELMAAHDAITRAHKTWDVLSSVATDRVRERTTATNSVTRTAVQLSRVSDGVIAGDQVGLRFQNANGADLDFFPGFLLVRERGATDYALIDLREVRLEAGPTRFIEEEAVPIDAQVVGQTWAKANKDGSADRRFNDNYAIPVVCYGALRFTTPSGVAEAYHVSNVEAAERFGRAFAALQAVLRDLAQTGEAGSVAVSRQEVTIDLAERLPALPRVSGAHEFTALAVAAIGGLGFYAAPVSLPREPPIPLTQFSNASAPALIPTAVSPPAPTPRFTTPIEPPHAPSATLAVPPALKVAPATVPQRERMILKQNANLRAAPDRAAATLRVVPIATTVAVFGRTGSWVQVGDASPWGWIHGSILSPAP